MSAADNLDETVDLVAAFLHDAARRLRTGSGDRSILFSEIPWSEMDATIEAAATRIKTLANLAVSDAETWPVKTAYFASLAEDLTAASGVPATDPEGIDRWVTPLTLLRTSVEQLDLRAVLGGTYSEAAGGSPQGFWSPEGPDSPFTGFLSTYEPCLKIGAGPISVRVVEGPAPLKHETAPGKDHTLEQYLIVTIEGLKVTLGWDEEAQPFGAVLGSSPTGKPADYAHPYRMPAKALLTIPLPTARSGRSSFDAYLAFFAAVPALPPIQLAIAPDPEGWFEAMRLVVDPAAGSFNDALSIRLSPEFDRVFRPEVQKLEDLFNEAVGNEVDEDEDDSPVSTPIDSVVRLLASIQSLLEKRVSETPIPDVGDDNFFTEVLQALGTGWSDASGAVSYLAGLVERDLVSPIQCWVTTHLRLVTLGPWTIVYINPFAVIGKEVEQEPVNRLDLFVAMNGDTESLEVGLMLVYDSRAAQGSLRFDAIEPFTEAAGQALEGVTDEEVDPVDWDWDRLAPKPGFTVRLLTDDEARSLLGINATSWDFQLCSALAMSVDELSVHWDRDEYDYVITLDGRLIIRDLLRPAKSAEETEEEQTEEEQPEETKKTEVEPDDLVIPFEDVGLTFGGRPVMKSSWLNFPRAMGATLPATVGVPIVLDAFGFGRDRPQVDTVRWWVGFSGGLRFSDLDLNIDLDQLHLYSDDPWFSLSGIDFVVCIAKVLRIEGQVAWDDAMSGPTLPAAQIKGFSASLDLTLIPVDIQVLLGFSHFTVQRESGPDFIAWSLFGFIDFPAPIYFGIPNVGLKSAGFMIAENYAPRPKVEELALEHWFDQGFDGDPRNLLDTARYWSIQPSSWAVGLSVGLSVQDGKTFVVEGILVIAEGPIIMLGATGYLFKQKAKASQSGLKASRIDVLAVVDFDDPGLLMAASANVAIKADTAVMLKLSGTIEFFFDFDSADNWYIHIGEPTRPIVGKVLFYAGSVYFMVDPDGIRLGLSVFYGLDWELGPLRVVAFISFDGKLALLWEPEFFVAASVRVTGMLGVSAFGLGFSFEIWSELSVKAPDPLIVAGELCFDYSFDLLFTRLEGRECLDFQWGSDGPPPDVDFEELLDGKVVSPHASSLRHHEALGIDPDTGTPLLAMDGVLAFVFDRDIEVQPGAAQRFHAFEHVTINDQLSPGAGNVKRFRAQLGACTVERHDGTDWKAAEEKRFFSWFPRTAKERANYAARDYELGYKQFRLNDDPYAWVRLQCPSLYSVDGLLRLTTDLPSEPLTSYGVPGPVRLTAGATAGSIDVSLLYGTGFELDYGDLIAELSGSATYTRLGRALAVGHADELTVDRPASCLQLHYEPILDGALDEHNLSDHLALEDQWGDELPVAALIEPAGSGGYRLTLHPFEGVGLTLAFSRQVPPTRGVQKVCFKQPALLHPLGYDDAFVALYPVAALTEVHRRNSDRLQDLAHLTYLFEEEDEEGKPTRLGRLLWPPGDYQVRLETEYETDAGKKAQTTTTRSFTVVPPFAPVEALRTDEQGNTERVAVDPFEPAIRRFEPLDKDVVYRDQHIGILFRRNTMHARLDMAGHKLVLVVKDPAGAPAEVVRTVEERVEAVTTGFTPVQLGAVSEPGSGAALVPRSNRLGPPQRRRTPVRAVGIPGEPSPLTVERTERRPVELRYEPDHFDLDVSSLGLDACVGAEATDVGAYERGAFRPVIDERDTWPGLAAETRYTAAFHAMPADEPVTPSLLTAEPLAQIGFTTSRHRTPDDWRRPLAEATWRRAPFERSVTSLLDRFVADDPGIRPVEHPGGEVGLHVGADLHRRLGRRPTPAAGGQTPLELEEHYQALLDEVLDEDALARRQEHLHLDRLWSSLGLRFEPVDRAGIRATVLCLTEPRPPGGAAAATAGTFGIFVELPEPLDWRRASFGISRFTVGHRGREVDLSRPTRHYSVGWHWLRSLDGQRILLVPNLVHGGALTVITPPTAATRAAHGSGVDRAARRSVLSDAAVSVDRSPFAPRATVWDYEVIDLSLDLYYLSRNYEERSASPYRPIPPLTYQVPRRDPDLGLIGSLALTPEQSR